MKTILTILLLIFSILPFVVNGQYYYSNGLALVSNTCIKQNIGDDISERTLQIFRNADANSDGQISVNELKNFQHWLTSNYRYKNNSTALHPDDFIAQGGGDCEDFAIMTTCMLNYHGVVAYVAGFGRVTVNKHAVCIAQVKDKQTSGYLYYTIMGWGIPPGNYIPIDYEYVGGLKAIDRRWKIARISVPAMIYGKYM